MPLYDAEYGRLLRRLRDLLASSADVEGVAVVTVDGQTLAWSLPDKAQKAPIDLLAASWAVAASLGANLLSAVGQQALEQAYIKGESGYVIIMPMPGEMLLIALVREQAKLGLIFLHMARAVNSPLSPDDLDSPLAPDPIFPPRPPKTLRGRARPEN
jgi:uncharacterized protein